MMKDINNDVQQAFKEYDLIDLMKAIRQLY